MRQIHEIISDLVRIKQENIDKGFATEDGEVISGKRKEAGDSIREIIERLGTPEFSLVLFEQPFSYWLFVNDERVPERLSLRGEGGYDEKELKRVFYRYIHSKTIRKLTPDDFKTFQDFEMMKSFYEEFYPLVQSFERWVNILKTNLALSYFIYNKTPEEGNQEATKEAWKKAQSNLTTLIHELKETWFWEHAPKVGDMVYYFGTTGKQKGEVLAVGTSIDDLNTDSGWVTIKSPKGGRVNRWLVELPTLTDEFTKTELYRDFLSYKRSQLEIPENWKKYIK